MRKGKEILVMQIGQKLQEGIIQSFVLNGEIKDDVNVLYLKFNAWIRIIADGTNSQINNLINSAKVTPYNPKNHVNKTYKYIRLSKSQL